MLPSGPRTWKWGSMITLASSNPATATASPVRSASAGISRTQAVQDRSTLEDDATGIFGRVATGATFKPPGQTFGTLCSEMKLLPPLDGTVCHS